VPSIKKAQFGRSTRLLPIFPIVCGGEKLERPSSSSVGNLDERGVVQDFACHLKLNFALVLMEIIGHNSPAESPKRFCPRFEEAFDITMLRD
jgi:hypothetical protein